MAPLVDPRWSASCHGGTTSSSCLTPRYTTPSLREWIPIIGFLDEMRRCKIVHKHMGQTCSWMSCARSRFYDLLCCCILISCIT